jgi:hypothetical protein
MTNNKNLSFKKIKKIYHEEVKQEQPVVEVKIEQLEVLPELAPIVEHKPEPVKVVEGTEAAVDEFLAALGATNLVEVVSTAPIPKVSIPASSFVDTTKLDDFLKNIQEEAPTPVTPLTKQVVDLTKPVTSKKAKPTLDPNIKAINDRLGFFEKRLGDLAMRPMGQDPGGGETKFRFLDDVSRPSINDNWVLEYDAESKKFQFTEDIGPIKTIKLNNAGPDITPVPGMLSWNTAEDCMNIHQNDGTVLQTGLETYIRVHNHTGVPLLNGEVVRFGGVTADALGVPTARLMDADESQDPLFLIGVITSDIPNEETGRATTLGNVRNIDTTGTSVNETWEIGDILWVHPTLLGKMTKVKPTAPDLAVSVAAVMIVHATEGVILVRPNFAPRLSYGTFLNTGNHVATTANTPTNIPIDTVTKSRGFDLTGTTDSRVTCQISGLYNFSVSYQITSTNSSAKNIYFWLRRDGIDQPFTTRRQTITGNGVYQTFACTWTVSLTAGQYVQLMWAVSDTSVILQAPADVAFAPHAPSVLLTVTEAAL